MYAYVLKVYNRKLYYKVLTAALLTPFKKEATVYPTYRMAVEAKRKFPASYFNIERIRI